MFATPAAWTARPATRGTGDAGFALAREDASWRAPDARPPARKLRHGHAARDCGVRYRPTAPVGRSLPKAMRTFRASSRTAGRTAAAATSRSRSEDAPSHRAAVSGSAANSILARAAGTAAQRGLISRPSRRPDGGPRSSTVTRRRRAAGRTAARSVRRSSEPRRRWPVPVASRSLPPGMRKTVPGPAAQTSANCSTSGSIDRSSGSARKIWKPRMPAFIGGDARTCSSHDQCPVTAAATVPSQCFGELAQVLDFGLQLHRRQCAGTTVEAPRAARAGSVEEPKPS